MDKKILSLMIILSLGIIYILSGPYIATYAIKSALESKNNEKLSKNIDFNYLEQNLQDQLTTRIIAESSKELKDNPFGIIAINFPYAKLDNLIERYTSIEGLSYLMSGEVLQSNNIELNHNDKKLEILKDAKYTYISTNEFSVLITNQENKEIKFLLNRYGLKWKLTNIILNWIIN